MPDENGNTNEGDGQTTETTSQTTTTTTGITQQSGDSDAAGAADFQVQLERNKGDALRLAEKLHDRVYILRKRAQEAEAKLPKDGEVIIKADDVDLLKEYKRLGSPNDLAAERARLEELRKTVMVTKAANVAGMNAKVLSKLLPNGAELEIGEATNEDGTAMQTVNLVQGEEKYQLAEYAQQNWSDFLPALQAETQSQTSGTPWIAQQSSKVGDATNGMNPLLKKKLEEAKAKQQLPS